MIRVYIYCFTLSLVYPQCTGDAGCTDVQSDHTCMLQSIVVSTVEVEEEALFVDSSKDQVHAQISFAKEARLYWDRRSSSCMDFLAAQSTIADSRSGAPVSSDVHALQIQLQAELKLATEFRLHWDQQLSALQAPRPRSLVSGAAPVSSKASSASPKLLSPKSSRKPVNDGTKASIEKQAVDPAKEDPGLLSQRPILNVKVMILCLICIAAALYLTGNLGMYKDSHAESQSWYNDSEFLRKVVASTTLIWFAVGMVGFSEFFEFTDENRHLTMVESVYLCAQILTTVGYGDLTPSFSGGKTFMLIYSFAGVSIVATLIQEIIFLTMEASAHKIGIRNPPTYTRCMKLLWAILPVIFCIAFGTAFFSLHPGETISTFEAFYMSIITLLSIGFGVYHPITESGKLVGAIWMVVGVACMGRWIMWLTNILFQQRRKLSAQSAAQDIFAELDKKGKGYIEQAEFMEFEMVRSGIQQSVLDEVKHKFASLDKDGSGSLNLSEFQEYVALG